MSYTVVIPARYQSSRLPGKPLADIGGKPMIQWVYEQSMKAGADNVIIATDDARVEKAAKAFGATVCMTSPNHESGTERLAEVIEVMKIPDDHIIVNVQGDEPLIEPKDILSVIDKYQQHPETVINAMCPLSGEEEFRSFTVPKVVASKSGNLLYMSRSPVPISKTNGYSFGFKQVCIYAFSKAHLEFFASHQQKTAIEEVEDIEILRFLENDIAVQMIEVDSSSIAVDVPLDVDKVLKALQQH